MINGVYSTRHSHESYHTLYVSAPTTSPHNTHTILWKNHANIRRHTITRTRSVCHGIANFHSLRLFERRGHDLWHQTTIYWRFATQSRSRQKIRQKCHKFFIPEFAIFGPEQAVTFFMGAINCRRAWWFYDALFVKRMTKLNPWKNHLNKSTLFTIYIIK